MFKKNGLMSGMQLASTIILIIHMMLESWSIIMYFPDRFGVVVLVFQKIQSLQMTLS